MVTEWLPAAHRVTYFIIHTQVKRASLFPNRQMNFLTLSQWASTEPNLKSQGNVMPSMTWLPETPTPVPGFITNPFLKPVLLSEESFNEKHFH